MEDKRTDEAEENRCEANLESVNERDIGRDIVRGDMAVENRSQ